MIRGMRGRSAGASHPSWRWCSPSHPAGGRGAAGTLGPRPRYLVPCLPGGQRVEHGHLQAPDREEEQGLEAIDARRLHAAAPRLRPPNYGIPFDVVDGSHPDRARRLRLRRRERSRSLSVRARHPGRRRVRPAREHDRPRHVHALRAVRRGVERRQSRRPGAARSSTWRDRTRTTCARDAGRRPTRPGSRSSPASCDGTRSRPARSNTRSGSR